jgi:hypothetical protein
MADIQAILTNHNRRYPLWSIDDLYKLLHQSALGSEHQAPVESDAERRLNQEIAQLNQGPFEPLIDPISPDGGIVRVHLEPFVRKNLDPKLLLDAFIQTGREFQGVKSQLEQYEAYAEQLAQGGLLPFDPADINQFFTRMNREYYPAVHHSPLYVARYQPAYRVVARRFIRLGVI